MPTHSDPAVPSTAGIAPALIDWFAGAARELPWRDPDASPWAVLVSEFMLQQTQVDRVLPRYLAWMERWPTPAALAADEPGEALRAWDRLGYPRRALWLHRAAQQIVAEHGGEVPRDVETLLSLTGIGPYTARAVAAFAFGDRHPVVDTNTRRVLARAVHGRAAAGMPSPQDLGDMERLLPGAQDAAQVFNAATMELGAIVCTARSPRCDACPIAEWCEWRGAGYPDNAPSKRPKQARFEGSDRQARGRILAALRSKHGAISRADALAAARGAHDAGGERRERSEQAERALATLISDELVVAEHGRIRLP